MAFSCLEHLFKDIYCVLYCSSDTLKGYVAVEGENISKAVIYSYCENIVLFLSSFAQEINKTNS